MIINRWQCEADTDVMVIASTDDSRGCAESVLTITRGRDKAEIWRIHLPDREQERSAYLSCIGYLCATGAHIAGLKHTFQLNVHLRNCGLA